MPYAPNRTINAPLAKDVTLAQVLEEYGDAASELQEEAQRAILVGNAQEARDLSIASGIMGDRWRELRDAPEDITEQPAVFTCPCHTSLKKVNRARKILKNWMPKALTAVRQLRNAMDERKANGKLPSSNIKNFATVCGISAQKIIAYANDMVAGNNMVAIMGAHRGELMQLMEKLHIAQQTIEHARTSGTVATVESTSQETPA